jgi:hypothetical protein
MGKENTVARALSLARLSHFTPVSTSKLEPRRLLIQFPLSRFTCVCSTGKERL